MYYPHLFLCNQLATTVTGCEKWGASELFPHQCLLTVQEINLAAPVSVSATFSTWDKPETHVSFSLGCINPEHYRISLAPRSSIKQEFLKALEQILVRVNHPVFQPRLCSLFIHPLAPPHLQLHTAAFCIPRHVWYSHFSSALINRPWNDILICTHSVWHSWPPLLRPLLHVSKTPSSLVTLEQTSRPPHLFIAFSFVLFRDLNSLSLDRAYEEEWRKCDSLKWKKEAFVWTLKRGHTAANLTWKCSKFQLLFQKILKKSRHVWVVFSPSVLHILLQCLWTSACVKRTHPLWNTRRFNALEVVSLICCSGRLLTCTPGSREFSGCVKDMNWHLYILKIMLSLNVVVLFPADPDRDRDVLPDYRLSTQGHWKPPLGGHGNAFSGARYSDFGAPCLLPAVPQSSAPGLRPSACLLELAQHLLSRPPECAYKTTEAKWVWIKWESWFRPAEQLWPVTCPQGFFAVLHLWDVPFPSSGRGRCSTNEM